MAVFLSPIGNGFQFLNTTLVLLNGGNLFTYAAGTTSQIVSYTSSLGTVSNANPIVMGSDGRPPNEIWFTGGQSYKMVLQDSLSNTIATYDNLYGIGDPNAPNASQGYFVLTSVAGANAITANANAAATLSTGNVFLLKVATTNTGTPVTLNITPSGSAALGATTVVKRVSGGTVNLAIGDFVSGNDHLLAYDGTNLQALTLRTYSQGTTVTAVGTVNLDTVTGDYITVSGASTQIASVTLAQGEERTAVWATAGTLSANSSLIFPIPAGNTVTTNTGDVVVFRGEASGIVRAVSVQRANALAGMTRQVLTSGSSQTYTPTLGTTWINVRMVGGGGSGGQSAGGATNGNTGSPTTFSTLVANGGSCGIAAGGGASTGGTATGGDINLQGASGSSGVNMGAASPPGGAGGSSPFGGAGGGVGANQAGVNATTNSGSGGSGQGGNSNASGGGGAAGGYLEKLITALAATYTYTIGAGGTAVTNTGQGGSGIIIVDEHKD